MTGPTLRVLDSLDAVARTAAQWVHDRAWDAVNARGRFTLALSGGNTPRALYRRMADGPRLPWDRTVFCFGDERNVPPDSPESNARMAREALTERTRWVTANWVEKFRTHRITMTFPVLNAAAEVLFIVAGEDKAWALKEVLKGTAPVAEIPSRGIVPTSGRITFLVDRAAAAGLGQTA